MGVIDIRVFGGLALGVAKRDLGPENAQVAENLVASVPAFAPLKQDGTANSIANLANNDVAKTLYRYPTNDLTAANIKGSTGTIRVVKGQITGDAKERHYVSGDGTAAPYVMYMDSPPTVLTRPLGVTYPIKALTLAVNEVVQFTGAELASQQAKRVQQIYALMARRFPPNWIAAGFTAGSSYPGYLDCEASPSGGYQMAGGKPYQARIFADSGAGIEDFTALANTQFAWALGVPYTQHTFGATVPTWSSYTVTTGQTYWAIRFPGYFRRYEKLTSGDGAAARSELEALTKPADPTDPEYTEDLLTSGECDELDALIDALVNPSTNKTLAAYEQAVKVRHALLVGLMNGTVGSTDVDKVADWLGTTAVQDHIDAAYDTFANTVYDVMLAAYNIQPNVEAGFGGDVGSDPTPAIFDHEDRAASVADIITEVKSRLATGGNGVSNQAIDAAKLYLDTQKRYIYKSQGTYDTTAGKKEAQWTASLALDFTNWLYLLKSVTDAAYIGQTIPGLPAVNTGDGEVTAQAVKDAMAYLEAGVRDLDAYLDYLPTLMIQAMREWAQRTAIAERHGPVDATGRSLYNTRAYTYTFVNEWGEESAPYLPGQGNSDTELQLLEVDQNDTVTVTLHANVVTHVASGQNITHWRLYRSNSSSTESQFQLVAQVAIGTTSYTDDKVPQDLLELLRSLIWTPPPVVGSSYLRGLVNHPGRFMAGYIDRTVYFSEPDRPYAWPGDYAQNVPYPIVALAVSGNIVFALTQAGPIAFIGNSPGGMSRVILPSNQACSSEKSVAGVTGGVVYASPDGLCLASQTGVQVYLPSPLGKADWTAYRPDLMACAEHDRVLYIMHGALDGSQTQALMAIDLSTMKITTLDVRPTAMMADAATDTLYVALPPASGQKPTQKALLGSESMRTGRWRSKRFTLEKPTSFAWVQVIGQQSASVTVDVKVYGYYTTSDGTEVEVLLSRGSGVAGVTARLNSLDPQRVEPERLVEWEVEVSSAARITRVLLASSTEELKAA